MLESSFPRGLRNTRPVPSLRLCTSCRKDDEARGWYEAVAIPRRLGRGGLLDPVDDPLMIRTCEVTLLVLTVLGVMFALFALSILLIGTL